MIIGIGIDSVEIERFAHWHTYADAQLLKIFSPEEIEYCRANPLKSAERFAVRFAAREALFKAVKCCNPQTTFLKLCKRTQIIKNDAGKPIMFVDWEFDTCEMIKDCRILISLTHTKTTATAMVILEQ